MTTSTPEDPDDKPNSGPNATPYDPRWSTSEKALRNLIARHFASQTSSALAPRWELLQSLARLESARENRDALITTSPEANTPVAEEESKERRVAEREIDTARDDVTEKAVVVAVEADSAAEKAVRQARIANIIAGILLVLALVPGIVDIFDGNEPTRVIVEVERP